jgi:hypothetical protein
MVPLRGGDVVTLAALRLLWQLEADAFCLALAGDRLRVSPKSRITPDLAAAIRQHRDELIALVRYGETIQ